LEFEEEETAYLAARNDIRKLLHHRPPEIVQGVLNTLRDKVAESHAAGRPKSWWPGFFSKDSTVQYGDDQFWTPELRAGSQPRRQSSSMKRR
jgi:hypothetical protein